MPRSRYRIRDRSAPHFLTVTVVNWLSLFSKPCNAQIMLDALCFMSERQRWTLYAYVLMEHHLHWLASAPDLVREVRSSKSYTARALINRLEERKARWTLEQLAHHRPPHKSGQQYQVWQDGSHTK